MNAKQAIVLIVGILGIGVTMWKGPGTWSAIATAATALALLVGTLRIVPKEDEEYIQDLEDALTKQQLSTNVNGNTETPYQVLPARSRERFARRVVRL